MEYKPLLSFIVPVYNSEKYIDKCIKSILNQTVKNFEVIIIDDGSKDNSLKICKRYERLYNNIRVFSQSNQGVSVARNNGLKKSNGEWIAFIDSDDEILPNYIESIICYINENKYNLIQFDFFGNEKKSKIKVKELEFQVYSKNESNELIKAIFGDTENHFNCKSVILRSPCTKVYKKSFIDKERIGFIPNLKMGEDFIFNINVYLKMGKMCYIRKGLYKVNERNDSTSRGYIDNMDEVDKLFYDSLKEIFIKHKVINEVWKLYYEEAFIGIMRCMKYQYFNRKCELSYKDIKLKMNEIIISDPYKKSIDIVKATGKLNRKIVAWLLYFKCFYILRIFYILKK